MRGRELKTANGPAGAAPPVGADETEATGIEEGDHPYLKRQKYAYFDSVNQEVNKTYQGKNFRARNRTEAVCVFRFVCVVYCVCCFM
jgi:hypothetical protein